MGWNDFLETLMLEKNPYKSDLGTTAKRKCEDSIIMRLELLLVYDMKIEESAQEKYLINKLVDNEAYYKAICCVDKDNPDKMIFDDAAYDIPRIKQVFWRFVEDSIDNSKCNAINQDKIKEFFFKIIEDDFESDNERTQFIKSFHISYIGNGSNVDDFYLNSSYDLVPPCLENKINEISDMAKSDELFELFEAYQVCVQSYDQCRLVRLRRESVFENITDEEKCLFRLLYLKFPRYLKDARVDGADSNEIKDDDDPKTHFDVLDAMKKNEWEKFSTSLKKELISCIEAMCIGDQPVILKYLKNGNDDIESIVEWLKFRIMWPAYYRVCLKLSFLVDLFLNDYRALDKVFGNFVVEGFEEELIKITNSYFDLKSDKEGSFIKKFNVAVEEVAKESFLEQIENALADSSKKNDIN